LGNACGGATGQKKSKAQLRCKTLGKPQKAHCTGKFTDGSGKADRTEWLMVEVKGQMWGHTEILQVLVGNAVQGGETREAQFKMKKQRRVTRRALGPGDGDRI